ncbi:MAG: HEAT repeat domain-containing protein [Pseudanabaenaceae cyanobacterium bins.68]|nr:HEAT repeat domain-containing protein [Pseudanabaenaceae cyanobacterium bins.68]
MANLASPDLSQRYYAAWWLGKMRVSAGVPALMIALEDQEDRTELGGYPLRRNAARALGKLGDARAIPSLIQSLDCEDFYVREAAAQAIEQLAASSKEIHQAAEAAIAPLLNLLEVNSLDQADYLAQPLEAILEALGRLQAGAAESKVAEFLDHPLPRIRFAAARAIYGISQDPDKQAECGQMLVAGLSNPDLNLRRTVLTDLGEIGYLPGAGAIAACQVENSFKLFALKRILELNLQRATPESINQIMVYMDDLL